MSLFSKLMGKKPKYVDRSAAELRQLEGAQSELVGAKQQLPLMRAYMDSLQNTAAAESQARGNANADVQQAVPELAYDPNRATAGAERTALLKGRALARIGFAGAQSVKDDAFRSKMAAVSYGKGVRAGANTDGILSDLEYSRLAFRNQMSSQKGGILSNLVGTLAGAGASTYANSGSGGGQ